MTANGCRGFCLFFFLDDESVLELDNGDGYTKNLVDILKPLNFTVQRVKSMPLCFYV